MLPHKDGTFDQFRPVTSLQHMIDDYLRDVGEQDRTHFDNSLDSSPAAVNDAIKTPHNPEWALGRLSTGDAPDLQRD